MIRLQNTNKFRYFFIAERNIKFFQLQYSMDNLQKTDKNFQLKYLLKFSQNCEVA